MKFFITAEQSLANATLPLHPITGAQLRLWIDAQPTKLLVALLCSLLKMISKEILYQSIF